MKRILLSALIAGSLQTAVAQDGNNICAWNAMNTYNTGGGAEDLERGIKCSDEAAVNESTAGKWKTWLYRGQLYYLVFADSTLKKQYGNAAFESAKAFKKVQEINDPKFRDWDEVFKYVVPLATRTFNEGVDQFQQKNYAQAYQYFYAIKDINAVLEAKGKPTNIDLAVALKNAAIAAENAGDKDGAAKVYKDWLTVKPEAVAYGAYAALLRRQGNKEEADKVTNEGLTKFPNDANLLVEKINTFLEASQYPEALTYVNNLIAVEPKNDGAYFIKGLAYEKIGNEDSVVFYYLKAAELNPKNVKPWNNLGALYVNKANTLVEQMNKLGNSSADTKKYEELKLQRKELYKKAKPYLEKAKELEPGDASITRTLKQIELYTTE